MTVEIAGQLPELIAAVYEAATDPAAWPRFLNGLAQALGGAIAIQRFEVRQVQGTVLRSSRLPAGAFDSYNAHFSHVNPWFLRRKHFVLGEPVVSSELCPDDDLVQTEFYNDFLRLNDWFYSLGAVLEKRATRVVTITNLRARAAECYTAAEHRAFQGLVPHVQRALQIQARISGLEAERDLALEALHRLPLGVIVVGHDGRPLLVNRTAREVIDGNDGLTLASDGLHAATAAETKALQRLVWEAALAGAGQGLGSGGALPLSRPSLKRPLSVLVAPLRTGAEPLFATAAAVVFVSDTERSIEAAPDLLQRLYDLTPAQSRLAAELIEGRTLEDAAQRLGVTGETARTTLKWIFARTDTSRQSELVRLLMRGPAVLRQH